MSIRPTAKESRNGLAAVAASSKRSPLFHWMVEQHDELIHLSASGGFTWRAVCAVAVDLRLVDNKGASPSLETARKTWARARAYVRKRRQAAVLPVHVPQNDFAPPMRSTAPVGHGSSVAAYPPGSTLPSWMPPATVMSSSEVVQVDRPSTGLNHLGETLEEQEIRTARVLGVARRTVAEAGGRIPPRKV